MERDNFNSYNFESSAESDDKQDEKKKKSATGLARLIAREEASKAGEKDDRSLLQKLAGETKPQEDAEAVEAEDGRTAEAQKETPLESLSAEEEIAVAETYVEQRTQQLANEVNAEGRPAEEVAEAEADQAFLEAVQARLSEKGDEADVDAAIEAAFQDTTSELADSEAPDEVDEPIKETVTSESSEQAPAGPQELNPDDAVPLGGSSGMGDGGRSVPPSPPSPPPASAIPPTGGGVSPHRPTGSGFDGTAGRTPNVAPRMYDDADVQRFERSAMGRGLLVGGAIGYLVGRRRGRIKTEKRLKAVQNKLEKQVAAVQQKIEQKEIVIRKLAREKTERTPVAAERSPTSASNQESTSASDTTEGRVGRPVLESRSEAARLPVESAKNAVDTLTKEELLAFSAQIKVGETSLRRVYEAKMVDEAGLRRLIKEYQAGHDLRRALAREFMVKELKFERDPTLRDLLPPEAQPKRSSESQTQEQKDAAVAAGGSVAGDGVNSGATQDSVASNTSNSTSTMDDTNYGTKSTSSRRQTSVSPVLLVGLTLATVVLAMYALWLTLTK